jgi:2-keto-4-pentenoate hydratase/2-oxohepta-3-ene-1,7-dioic acid hydratase in catechol pathway
MSRSREIGKSFTAHVLGPIHPAGRSALCQGRDLARGNGNGKQNSNLQNMIWSVAEQIAKLSEA